MKMSDAFPSRYLNALDVNGELVLTIRTVVKEEIIAESGEVEEKPILYFVEQKKGLVLNKTNWHDIALLYGEESDLWTGKRLVFHSPDVQYRGKMVPGIRVKGPARVEAPA